MSLKTHQQRTLKHFFAAVLFAAVAAGALHFSYWLEEPVTWTDPKTGFHMRLIKHAEGWRPVARTHTLDVAPGRRILGLEPLGGLAHISVRRLSCQNSVDPKEIIESIDRERRALASRYYVFWLAPTNQAWRVERSFYGLPGLKSIKRVTTQPGRDRYLVFDYVIQGSRGCWWYIGTFVREPLFTYYELDLKFHLASMQLGEQ